MRVAAIIYILGGLVLLHSCSGPPEAPLAAKTVEVKGQLLLRFGHELERIEGTDYAQSVIDYSEEKTTIVSPTAQTVLEVGQAMSRAEKLATLVLEAQEDVIKKIEKAQSAILMSDLTHSLRILRSRIQEEPGPAFDGFAEIAVRIRQEGLEERILRGDRDGALAESREVLAELERRIAPGLPQVKHMLAVVGREAEEIANKIKKSHEAQAETKTINAVESYAAIRQVSELYRDLRKIDTSCLELDGRVVINDSLQTLEEVLYEPNPNAEALRNLAEGLDEALTQAKAHAREGRATHQSLTALHERAKALATSFEALGAPTGPNPALAAEFSLRARKLERVRDRMTTLLAGPNTQYMSGPFKQALLGFAAEVGAAADALTRQNGGAALSQVRRAEQALSKIKNEMLIPMAEPEVSADGSTIWVRQSYQDEWKVARIEVVDGSVKSCPLAKGLEVRPTRSPTRAWLTGELEVRVLDIAWSRCELSIPRDRRPGTRLLHDGDVLVELAPEPRVCAEDPPAAETTSRIFLADGRVVEFDLPATISNEPVLVTARGVDRMWIADRGQVHQIDYAGATATVTTPALSGVGPLELDPRGDGVFVGVPGPRIIHLPSEAPLSGTLVVEPRAETCDNLLTWASGHAACMAGAKLLVRTPHGVAWQTQLPVSSTKKAIAVDHDGAPYLTVWAKSGTVDSVFKFSLARQTDALRPELEELIAYGVSPNGRYALLRQEAAGKFALKDLYSGEPERLFSLSRKFKEFEPFVHNSGNAVWLNTNDYDFDDYHDLERASEEDLEDLVQALLLVESNGLAVKAEVEIFGEPYDLAKPFSGPIPIPADENSLLLTFQSASFLPNMGPQQINEIRDHEFHLEVLGADDKLLLRTCEGCRLDQQRVPMMAPDGGTDIAALERGPVTLQLRYTDGRGSLVVITHTGVVFTRRFSLAEYLTRHPYGRAVSVYLLLLMITLLCIGVLRHRPRVLAFSPPALAGTAFTGVLGTSWSSTGLGQVVSVPLFAGLLGGTVMLATMLGLMSTAFLRRLVLIEPYRVFAPYLMLAPHVRRRWYAEFASKLRRRMVAESRLDADATAESYVPLPAVVEVYELGPDGEVRRRVEATSTPHAYVLDVLVAPGAEGRARVVVVEAPGGRGKSCLMRQIVMRMCEGAAASAERIAVACDVSAGGPAADLKMGLGVLGDCEPLVESELSHGRYLLVYDDAVTRGLVTKRVAEFCERNPAARFLIVTREFPALVRELESVANVYRVVPQLLNGANLAAFIRAYADEADVGPFAERALALRSAGDTYLPVLVRLGILAYQRVRAEMLTIDVIYDDVIRRLLEKDYDPDKIDAAIVALTELCRREYWVAGKPYLDYRRAQPPDKPLLKAGRKSGLLVDVGAALGGGEPERVRFFHDSLRSYLVARWAVQAFEPQGGSWDELIGFLEQTASLARFRESEIFVMALSMIAPGREVEVQAALSGRIEAWSRELAEALSPMGVKSSAPPEVEVDVRELKPSQAIAAVLEVIRLAPCGEPERLQRTAHFFRQLATQVAVARGGV